MDLLLHGGDFQKCRKGSVDYGDSVHTLNSQVQDADALYNREEREDRIFIQGS